MAATEKMKKLREMTQIQSFHFMLKSMSKKRGVSNEEILATAIYATRDDFFNTLSDDQIRFMSKTLRKRKKGYMSKRTEQNENRKRRVQNETEEKKLQNEKNN